MVNGEDIIAQLFVASMRIYSDKTGKFIKRNIRMAVTLEKGKSLYTLSMQEAKRLSSEGKTIVIELYNPGLHMDGEILYDIVGTKISHEIIGGNNKIS